MKFRGLVGIFLGMTFLCAVPSEAAQITVSHLHDWTGQTNSSGVTYAEFFESAPPSWTHAFTFATPAVSFDSAEVELSFGGTRSSQEAWLFWDAGSIYLGQLNGSGNNSANTIIQQTFVIPGSLFPLFPTTDWTIQLRLTEDASQNNGLFMDYSKLTLTYQTDETTSPLPDVVTPEPASMLLLGSGLIGVGVQRYRRRRASAV